MEFFRGGEDIAKGVLALAFGRNNKHSISQCVLLPYTAVSTIEFQHAHERCYIAVLGASVDDQVELACQLSHRICVSNTS